MARLLVQHKTLGKEAGIHLLLKLQDRRAQI
jgi:hypothetical protein